VVTVPKCMSTQHPDNVHSPFFAQGTVMEGEDEIQEAYYAFSHLGCDEQMWDCEGKETDDFVVKKLLATYGDYFRGQRIGKDAFITLRVPNPDVEKSEAKILLETLESIPRSFDSAKLFYGDDAPPIFEVIVPMTQSAKDVDRVYRFYRDFIIGDQHRKLGNDITVREWLGEFKPEKVNVIPLFEDKERILAADRITKEYLADKEVSHQRVFLARSDPAMNYGLVSAVLLNKIALHKLHALSQEIGVRIYPIVGVGSAPFRGNLRPQTVWRVEEEYAGAHTLTVQSAFKYDNPPNVVRQAIGVLREATEKKPKHVDEQESVRIMDHYGWVYQAQLMALAPVINRVSKYVPARRKRKLHVGLFGYSRSVEGVQLPRAITLTAALYSIGMPPELLGLNALSDREVAFVRENYRGFDADIGDALAFFNPKAGFAPEGLAEKIAELGIDYSVNEAHAKLTSKVAESLKKGENGETSELVLRAASERKFLG